MTSGTIEADGTGTHVLRCVARYFVRRASRALSRPELSDSAVHNARKDLKRCRTVVRLLRPALTVSVYRSEDSVLRVAAHTLNATRDSKVQLQTLASLRKGNSALRDDPAVAALLRTLRTERKALRQRLRERPAQLAHTRAALEQLYRRMDKWDVGSSGWSVLGPALRRIYKRGRRGLPAARQRPADRALHDWRKQVKYLRYALEILTPLRVHKLTRLARQAQQLTDNLGEAHDLAMLAQKARSLARRNRVDLQQLLAIIDQRRARLALDALRRGERLYRARPADWERPLSRYWRRWQRAA